MVFLAIITVDQQGEIREFSCQLPQLEKGLDFLTNVSTMGHTLIEAHLIEKGNRIPLPVKAFDQDPISPVIKQLETEWQQILS